MMMLEIKFKRGHLGSELVPSLGTVTSLNKLLFGFLIFVHSQHAYGLTRMVETICIGPWAQFGQLMSHLWADSKNWPKWAENS